MARLTVRAELVAWSFASISSVGTGMAASVQMLLDPANAWVPVGVLVTLLGISVVTTVKVVRLLDGMRADIRDGKRERTTIAKELGIDLGREDG